MKLYTQNYACMNRSDEYELICNKMLKIGFTLTDNLDEADYALIYTCGSTEAFIRRSYESVNDIFVKFPKKRIIVCGCATVTSDYLYKDKPFIICTPTDFSQLEKTLGVSIDSKQLETAYLTDDIKESNRKAIVVQKGCVRKCTYCAIWKAVGKIVSKDPKSIIQQVKQCTNNKIYDLTLTGDCVSDYGLDIGTNIIQLINAICSISPLIKLNIYDLHPQSFLHYSNDFVELSKNGKLNCLGIPIQSGSKNILKLMNRSFDINKFICVVNEMKKNDVKFTTDIIIGFPGEKQEDFNETIRVLKEIEFSQISLNVYTDLHGSASSKMKDKVSKKEIIKRYFQLNENGIRGIDKDFFEYQFIHSLTM